jgi:hypothetical protein
MTLQRRIGIERFIRQCFCKTAGDGGVGLSLHDERPILSEYVPN